MGCCLLKNSKKRQQITPYFLDSLPERVVLAKSNFHCQFIRGQDQREKQISKLKSGMHEKQGISRFDDYQFVTQEKGYFIEKIGIVYGDYVGGISVHYKHIKKKQKVVFQHFGTNRYIYAYKQAHLTLQKPQRRQSVIITPLENQNMSQDFGIIPNVFVTQPNFKAVELMEMIKNEKNQRRGGSSGAAKKQPKINSEFQSSRHQRTHSQLSDANSSKMELREAEDENGDEELSPKQGGGGQKRVESHHRITRNQNFTSKLVSQLTNKQAKWNQDEMRKIGHKELRLELNQHIDYVASSYSKTGIHSIVFKTNFGKTLKILGSKGLGTNSKQINLRHHNKAAVAFRGKLGEWINQLELYVAIRLDVVDARDIRHDGDLRVRYQ